MATKNLDLYKLGVKLEVDGAKGLLALSKTDKELKAVDQESKKVEKSLGLVGRALSKIKAVNYDGSGSGGGGGYLPGLGHVSNIIQGIPQVGNLLKSLISPLTEATESGIEFNAFLETSEIAFKKMLGSKGAAVSFMKDLRGFAGATPFRTEGLVRTAQYMGAVGFKGKEIIPVLRDIGDAISSTGEISEESVQNVARALGKMRGMGKVSAEEMESLADNGIPAWEMLAHAIGKTVAETRKLSEQGKLSGTGAAEALRAEMRARYGGMMDELQNTYKGRKSAAEDALQEAQAIATQPLFKDISGIYAAALTQTDLAKSLAGTIGSLISPVSGLVRASAATLVGGNLTAGLAEGITATQGIALEAVSSMGLGSIKALMGIFDINSPSGVTAEIGAGLIDGLAYGKHGVGGIASQESKEKLRGALDEVSALIAEGLESGVRKYGSSYKAIIEAARRGGFSIPHPVKSTTGGTHGRNSAHYSAQAVDIRTRDKTRAEGDVLIATLRAKGLYVVDERDKPGQPHIHAQFGTRGIRNPSAHGGGRFTKQARSLVTSALSSLDQIIDENSRRTGIPGHIIRGLIMTESSGRPGVVSSAGAVGLMQVKPSTAAPYVGAGNLKDPATNIYAGTSYLADLLKRYGGDMNAALQAYNVGPGNFAKGMRNNYPGKVLSEAAQFTTRNPLPVTIASGLGMSFSAGGDGPAQALMTNTQAVAGLAKLNATIQASTHKLALNSQQQTIDRLQALNTALDEMPPHMKAAASSVAVLPPSLQPVKTELKNLEVAFGHAAKTVIMSGESMSKKLMSAMSGIGGIMPQQQVGKKRGFFSKLLGIASPFLGMIPGVGPLLSTLANMGSAAAGGDWGSVLTQGVTGFSAGGAFRRSSGSGTQSVSFANGIPTPPTGTNHIINLPLLGRPQERARGGPVSRGRAYLVGEHRPEVVQFGDDGYVHPSIESFSRREAGGGFSGGGKGGSWNHMIERMLAALEQNTQATTQLHTRVESMPAGDMLAIGARQNPGAIGDGLMRAGSRDPKVVEWMQRRTS